MYMRTFVNAVKKTRKELQDELRQAVLNTTQVCPPGSHKWDKGVVGDFGRKTFTCELCGGSYMIAAKPEGEDK